jgi:chemotaxis protein histidine kinase CheA
VEGEMALSLDEQTKYKTLYLQTASQYVKEMKENVDQLLTGNETTEVIDAIHLAAHSLKGQSQMMAYPEMTSISSIIEKIFRAKKEGTLTLSDDLVAKLPEAVSAMEACLESIEKNNKENNDSEISKTLQTLSNIKE